MTERDNGGLITPRRRYVKDGDGMTEEMQGGMTLRDMFAAQALAGIAQNTLDALLIARLAKSAYALADAMLAERSKS